MRTRKQKDIVFKVLDDMELYGVRDDLVMITCRPVEGTNPLFGFAGRPAQLREWGAGLIEVAKQVEKRNSEKGEKT